VVRSGVETETAIAGRCRWRVSRYRCRAVKECSQAGCEELGSETRASILGGQGFCAEIQWHLMGEKNQRDVSTC
jgi:hypothetical protein